MHSCTNLVTRRTFFSHSASYFEQLATDRSIPEGTYRGLLFADVLNQSQGLESEWDQGMALTLHTTFVVFLFDGNQNTKAVFNASGLEHVQHARQQVEVFHELRLWVCESGYRCKIRYVINILTEASYAVFGSAASTNKGLRSSNNLATFSASGRVVSCSKMFCESSN